MGNSSNKTSVPFNCQAYALYIGHRCKHVYCYTVYIEDVGFLIIREYGGEEAVRGMKIHQKMKKFAKQCKPMLESLPEEEKKMCLIVLKELKKFETKK